MKASLTDHHLKGFVIPLEQTCPGAKLGAFWMRRRHSASWSSSILDVPTCKVSIHSSFRFLSSCHWLKRCLSQSCQQSPCCLGYTGKTGRAEKRTFQNRDSFWYSSSIFCKQTLIVAINKTSNNRNIFRRRTRDIKPCTLGEVLF